MFTTCKPLILASASPRRQQFLTDFGLQFTALAADIAETPLNGEKPDAFARRMAEEKAEVIARQHPASWVIGADTVVTIEGRILGKPNDEAHALEILRSLQGKKHEVITGLALRCVQENCTESLSRTTEVKFADFSDAILSAYVQTGEPMDKAGAYGIQGKGGFLVRSITGSSSNVVGLPINTCINLLLHYKIIAPLQEKK
ncbi:septum formation protein [Candidatus Electrothrix aarhusensis]|uniref:dTTP/UTP pyrophosphatase n=1 Tax=Candidatus Electrothrix aarhusensis TaxID=1859131 RepID=A0A444ISD7_9BACT|nr:septum formation protein [Candidatus Electrothrix aarhusensis]